MQECPEKFPASEKEHLFSISNQNFAPGNIFFFELENIIVKWRLSGDR